MIIEHADNVTINLAGQRQLGTADLLAWLFSQPIVGAAADSAAAPVASTPSTKADAATDLPPVVGEIWKGRGGIYVGIARGYDGKAAGHLVMALAEPTSLLNWQQAVSWAEGIEADGHKDFHLPTREESALIYANAKDKVHTDRLHWTSTQSSASDAYYQYFYYGGQDYDFKSYEGRARAVRRFPL